MKSWLFFAAVVISWGLHAQEPEKIRLQVRIVNSLNGVEITNASVLMMDANTDRTIPLKAERRNRYYEVVKGAPVRISIEASQFYKEEKRLETDQFYDLEVVELQLTPKPEEVVALAPFFVVVRELASGDRLEERVEVTRPSGMVDYVASGATYIPTEEGEYQFAFRKEGFGAYTQKMRTALTSEKALLPVTFEVRTLSFSEHEYILVDAVTGQRVEKTQLLILDENGRPVETLYNSSSRSYLTYRIQPERKYTAEAKAEGYEPLRMALANATREITLQLMPANLEQVTLAIRDGYTLEPLSQAKINVWGPGGSIIPVQQDDEGPFVQVPTKSALRIQVATEGYPAFDQTVSPMASSVEVLLRKAAYPLRLMVQNALTDVQFAGAEIRVTGSNGRELPVSPDRINNAFEVLADPDEVLQITVSVPDFRPFIASNNRKQLAQLALPITLVPLQEEQAAMSQTNTETAEPDVLLAKKGRRYALKGVNFEQSSTSMLPGSEGQLQEVLEFLQKNPSVKIEVIGHTDRTGDERQNVRLSEFRARAVANWLFNKGIDARRIATSGKGSAEPLASNETEDGKAQNRRIEVLVVEE